MISDSGRGTLNSASGAENHASVDTESNFSAAQINYILDFIYPSI